MMGVELLRIVDAIHRDKNIEKELVFRGIELALANAARKHYGLDEAAAVDVAISRQDGAISAVIEGRRIEPEEFGRIAAQTAKQVIIQKIREAEQDVLFEEYLKRVGSLAHGTVQRFEGANVIINLGKAEAILPRGEQIYSESYQPGDRLRLYICDVKKAGAKVRIIVSRTVPDLVRRLFELEVPEIAENIITIRSIAREAGYRSKIAVQSSDSKIDCVGACVGVRGSRIKSIVEELNGEKIDIVRWSDNPNELVAESLKPAKVGEIYLDEANHMATVVVDDAQLSLAIGRRGQNVRLASRLCGWEIDIVSKSQLAERASESVAELSSIEAIGADLAANLYRQGYQSLQDLADIGPEALAALTGVGPEKALEIMANLEKMANEYAAGGETESTEQPADGEQAPAPGTDNAPAEA
jgi:N utilization substance protein A